MISTTNTAYNLTVDNTASPPYTLKVMTVVAVILLPVVVVYQAWAYHVFKARLTAPKVDGGDTASPAEVVTGGDVAPGSPAEAT